MQNTRIISDGQEITSVGLGCMGFSHAYGAPTEKNEAVSMIRKAYDMGYNFFDTAECYPSSCAEQEMVRFLIQRKVSCTQDLSDDA